MVKPQPPDAGSLGTAVTFAQYNHEKRNNRARIMGERSARLVRRLPVTHRSLVGSESQSEERPCMAEPGVAVLAIFREFEFRFFEAPWNLIP